MPLNSKMKQKFKADAHKLKPIVIVGNNGLTETVHTEIDRALTDHELIKMRVNSEDRDERRETFAEICAHHHAELIQVVGKIGILYRVSDKDKNNSTMLAKKP
jgi:RNA-binding protein